MTGQLLCTRALSGGHGSSPICLTSGNRYEQNWGDFTSFQSHMIRNSHPLIQCLPRNLGTRTRNTRSNCVHNCDPCHITEPAVHRGAGGSWVSEAEKDVTLSPPIPSDSMAPASLTPSKLLLPLGWAELLCRCQAQ